MKNLAYLISIAICLSSCRSTNLVFISVKEPAPVTVPNYVKSVAIVNRSIASDKTKVLDAIHKVFSLESKTLVEEGGKACINGLNDEMIANNRFERIVKLDTTELRSFGAGVFPSPLDWAQVEKICSDTKTDALFSLELFDTDTKLSYSTSSGVTNTVFGKLPLPQHHVNMNTLVRTGWRMYDPAGRVVLDEWNISKDLQFSGNGINPVAAAGGLIGKKEAVIQVSNMAGHLYASRIDPYWIRVHRDYFVKGSANLAMAKRKAQTGNWDDAGELWKKETNSGSGKVAGRACYNMAIINEINGDIDGAIMWAQKAYENYNVKIALRYVNILRNRKANNELLRMQNSN
ncbi:MAG: hypothetical protein JWM28_2827 [Chitinophagaceae bacterium]|nr:hypothetical protein [Chitinophagaceae bacterium]